MHYLEFERPIAELEGKIVELKRLAEEDPNMDIDAEVERLEALGAKRVRAVKTWWVMEAPTGHRFCVVRPQSPDFPTGANRWE